MLNVIASPKGMDVAIRQLQEQVHDYLALAWGINSSLYQSYGRCYRNKKDKGYVAEVYAGTNEYKEVYWDDNLAAISFFGISGTIKHAVLESTEVHLIFFVNLSKVKSLLTNRADEEVRIDVIKAADNEAYGFTFKSVDLLIENVLKEYAGSYRDERLKVVDMHPIHCFRLNFTLNYNIESCY